jgi:hypothetical protein
MTRPLLLLHDIVEHCLKAHNDRHMLPNIIITGWLILHDLLDHFLMAIHVYKQKWLQFSRGKGDIDM